MAQGYIQPQFKFFINLYQTGEEKGVIEYDMRDFKVPYLGNRWFLDHSGRFGTYPDPDLWGYANRNRTFTGERAGANDSNRENFIQSSGTDERFWFRLGYTLPIADARLSPIKNYVLKDGLLESGASGGTSWNPLESGVTAFELKYFYRRVKFDFEEDENFRTNGFEFKLIRDNRDYSTNPSKGSYQSFTIARDFGWGNSDDSWTNWQLDLKNMFPSANRIGQIKEFLPLISGWPIAPPGMKRKQRKERQSTIGRPTIWARHSAEAVAFGVIHPIGIMIGQPYTMLWIIGTFPDGIHSEA